MSETWVGRRVLVTGASGFIGSHLCARLSREGADVIGLSRQTRSGSGITWAVGDVGDEASVRAAITKIQPSVIYHLASHVAGARGLELVSPTFHSNLASTVYLMTAAADIGVARFVLTGSQEEPNGTAEDMTPTSPYAAAKWASTAYARMFHALYDFPVVHLRVFMVYGPDQKDLKKLVPYVILESLAGRTPKIGSGTRRVDWVYIDDVVDAFVKAGTAPDVAGKSLEVGTGKLTSIRDVVDTAVQAANPGITAEFGAAGDRKMEVERSARIEQTAALLGWSPAVDITEGLQRTAAWYRDALAEGRIS